MYSALYFYFYIRFDSELSESKPVDNIKAFLGEVKQIEEKNRVVYKNTDTFPWIDISLLNAESYDNWILDRTINHFNLIAIVGSKNLKSDKETIAIRYSQYVELLIKIADFLNWELVDEETEDGLEDYILYSPRIKK